ncbi:LicD family protein [Fusobacterium varium]|uniref:LicD family protein n=1 Tax=Fusobacterium varium TaxID=856 RepID=UPI0032C147C6
MDYLKKMQFLENEILDFIVKICSENNLKYWLDFGTLLGAVRHQGFIPWDDDIDIAMQREDYKKFQNFFSNYDSDGRFDIIFYEDKFLKVIDKKSYVIDEKGEKINIFVDIFPFDYYSNKILINFIDKFFIEIHKYKTNKTFIKSLKNIFINLRKEIYKKVLKKIFIKKRLTFSERKLYMGRAVETNFKINILRIDEIFPLSKLEFENKLYNVPKQYDKYLKKIYGNYMKFPPENERHTHQIVKELYILNKKVY